MATNRTMKLSREQCPGLGLRSQGQANQAHLHVPSTDSSLKRSKPACLRSSSTAESLQQMSGDFRLLRIGTCPMSSVMVHSAFADLQVRQDPGKNHRYWNQKTHRE